jgi:hypothetical protein
MRDRRAATSEADSDRRLVSSIIGVCVVGSLLVASVVAHVGWTSWKAYDRM